MNKGFFIGADSKATELLKSTQAWVTAHQRYNTGAHLTVCRKFHRSEIISSKQFNLSKSLLGNSVGLRVSPSSLYYLYKLGERGA